MTLNAKTTRHHSTTGTPSGKSFKASAKTSSENRPASANGSAVVPSTKALGAELAATGSLHQRILGDIEQRILSGEWPPGHRIPSELELTGIYQCSRMTVNKVLTQLARANMVERRRKAGSFVMSAHSRAAVLDIHDIRSEVLALGQPYFYELVDRRNRRSLRADMEALELGKAGPVVELQCLHHAGSRPFCLEYRLINLTAVPQATEMTFLYEPPGSWLVSHVPWSSAEHRISAGAADANMATLLKVKAGSPCLIIQRRTWTGESPVTFARLIYPGTEHELIARFSPTKASNEASNGL